MAGHDFPVKIAFVEHLGLELVSFGEGVSELGLQLRPELLNSWAVAHGGVLMTLLDVAMAIAARAPRAGSDEWSPGVVTVEMKTSFMRPGEGEHLRATGRLLHRSTTMAFCEGSVFDDAGHLCAHATGTFKFLKALPGRGRALKALQTSSD